MSVQTIERPKGVCEGRVWMGVEVDYYHGDVREKRMVDGCCSGLLGPKYAKPGLQAEKKTELTINTKRI